MTTPLAFTAEQLTDDAFLGGRISILQPRDGYRAAMDPVLLAAATPAKPSETVLDLGCGAGVAGLCLAARVPGIHLTGLEIQAAYADLARQNALRNAIAMTVITGDLTAPPADLRALTFDHVITNPPYHPTGGGTAARDAGRETALREATPLAEWILAATRRLRPGGTLTLIQSADRLPSVLAAMPATVGSILLGPVAPRIGRPANRIILRARKGGRAAFRLLPPLILHDGERHMADGDSFSPAARAILRDMQALSL